MAEDKTPTVGGMKRPGATTAAYDPVKHRIAKKATGAASGMFGARQRNAGMMLDNIQSNQPYSSGFQLDAYRTSYANGLDHRSGTYDVPSYFVTMNEQNGGILYWPVTLQEKYQWYRYWARTDAYCGRALELLSDLPMSKLTLNMPKMEGKEELRKEIQEFFEYQMEVLGLFELCQDALWEWNMIGNVYIFHEWDAKKKMWSRVQMLPPEEVYVFEYPFDNGNKRVEYRPERLISIIKGSMNSDYGVPTGDTSSCDSSDIQQKIVKNIPKEIVKMVKDEGCIVMDSDPTTGSFVHHIARRKSRYHDLGASVLERVLIPMLQKEHYRYTQLSLASRNMTPRNLITAPGLLPQELDDLRTQVDLSYMDPDYSIITNYEVNWEQIGAQDRLLQLDSEYERIENQVFAALGVTRELLTGEGSFSGNKITVEILNTMFLLTREVLKNYIEQKLFVPVAEAHGWYEEGKNGVKKYLIPSIGFNRLTIRDNAEVFDSLFQLYQKGSLDIDLIYELFNINSDEVAIKLYEQMFTIKDSTFNRMLEEVHSEMGRKLPEESDIFEKFLEYLNLKRVEPEGEEEGGFGGFGEDESGGGMDFGLDEGGEPDLEAVADEVAAAVPEGTSDKEIFDIVNKVTEDSGSESPPEEEEQA
jgi:hypothetical protein